MFLVVYCLLLYGHPSHLVAFVQHRNEGKNVTSIIEVTGLGQANVSKHLKVLTQAGMVARKPQGISVYYEIADPVIFAICDLVCKRLSIRLEEQTYQLEQLQALRQQ